MSAPVLSEYMCSSAAALSEPPSAARSIDCPPVMPVEPLACATSCTSWIRVLRRDAIDAGEHPERQRLKRVGSKNGGCLVKLDVCGRLATTQVVVVHRRQIIVHQ